LEDDDDDDEDEEEEEEELPDCNNSPKLKGSDCSGEEKRTKQRA
jgi:hypothetical protein